MKYSFTLLICFNFSFCFGQLSLQLNQTAFNETESCYDIIIKNDTNESYDLHGQNLRFYYDSKYSILKEKNITSYLNSSYTEMLLKQHFHNTDATGFGPLEFEDRMGFVNIAVDFNNQKGGAHELTPHLTMPVANVCFEQFGINNTANIIWAQEDLTSTYATAFVEILLYSNSSKKYTSAQINNFSGIHSDTVEIIKELNLDYYPNPFQSEFRISYNHPTKENGQVVVTDVFGQEVLRRDILPGDKELYVQANELNPGAYFFTVNMANGYTSSIKAIKVE